MNENERPGDALGATVRVEGVRVGVVTAILTNGEGGAVFGLEVSAQGGERWFLPSVAAGVDGRDVHAASALHFGGADQLDTYARRGAHVVRAETDGEERVLASPDGGTTTT